MTEMITGVTTGVKEMSVGIVLVAIIVLMAMTVDLVAGLYKAHLRGDARRSEALKRTGYKFLLYEGTILIASGIDILIHIAKIPLWFGWDLICNVPLVTILIGIFWCVVEFLSVREKADEKIHSDISKAERMAAQILKIVEAVKRGEPVSQEMMSGISDDPPSDKACGEAKAQGHEQQRTSMVVSALLFSLVCCVGCSTRKDITQTMVVHDTLTILRSDTVRVVKTVMVRDTTRHEVERIITLKASGDTLRMVTTNNIIRYIGRSDSTDSYQAVADSLQRKVHADKDRKTVRARRMTDWRGYLFVAVLSFVVAVLFLLRKKN